MAAFPRKDGKWEWSVSIAGPGCGINRQGVADSEDKAWEAIQAVLDHHC